MYIRYLIVFLASLLIVQLSMAQNSNSGGAGLEQYRLSGVLISDNGRTALVNGRSVQEGTTIGDAVVEAIEKRQIRIRTGSGHQIVRIGGSFTAAPSQAGDRQMMVVTRSSPTSERWPLEPGHKSESTVAAAHNVAADEARSAARLSIELVPPDDHRKHSVSSGETLSGIALRYRPDGVTTNQMMVAMFEANPAAFNGDINSLKAGATLRIPDETMAGRLAPDVAMARVSHQYERSRDPVVTAPLPMADTQTEGKSPTGNADRTYGPVQRGDTLSEIARDISQAEDSVSDNQVMIALYQENPHAFGDSINLLYEGAVLTIPPDTRIAALSPSDAAAEVERQLSVARRAGRGNEDDDPGFNVNTILSAGDPADWMNWQWQIHSPH